MVHLYALAAHPVRLPDDSELRSVQVDGIDAVWTRGALVTGEATEHEIVAHAGVVEQIAELNDAVLPARLGTPYEDERAVRAAVRGRVTQLREALERVRGCVEMGVRVLKEETGTGETVASGGEYMRARLEQIREAERLAGEIQVAVGATAREAKQQVLATPQLLLTAAYLVPRDDVQVFRNAVEAMQRRRGDVTIVCTGPWPPYSFALVEGGPSE